MTESSSIRLLSSTNNERGDLFTRLIKDLFFALGYDDLRLNVHNTGRELDIQGKHRFERGRFVGECKAHTAKIGGDELNKFFGVLQRERIKHAPTQVAGYFVSISGFTETGIEQEMETGADGLILLGSQKVVEELEKCRVIVTRDTATEQAGRCAQHARVQDIVLDGVELLGHRRGYIWAVYYAGSKQRSHVALIHADGTPLAEAVASEIIEADRLCGGSLQRLEYLAPSDGTTVGRTFTEGVNAKYRKWIAEECGYIYLDGLPADSDLSATRLKLERLFVPLQLIISTRSGRRRRKTYIGRLLETNNHIVLLAAPGSGKSTLLKRLATAYSFPERLLEISDHLPTKDWLPLVLRCRELRDRAYRPIIELLDEISRHAGMNLHEREIFQQSVHEKLRGGSILLLVDGLDEISDESARQAFASHLRTFVGMFPQSALVVTSREAGFRLIAGVIASACRPAKLASLTEEDVTTLCESWHAEVIGNNPKVRTEARELAQAIWSNERIGKLAENPLLLTTLLVVKRWIGELPRSRTARYRETIRVLIRTWNVEGYQPLDEDETLAQLSYVACAMTESGKNQIDRRALLKLLHDARHELEAELQFARTSPQEFLDRIEYRSSLLMQTGHSPVQGVPEPIYEFRHLTFQEYLAARGYVEEQYPNRGEGKSLADMLESHFKDERWREVITLAAVLAGRKAEELIKQLTAALEHLDIQPFLKKRRDDPLGQLLYQCLRDEVQVTAPVLRKALLELARSPKQLRRRLEPGWIERTLDSKFGRVFREVVAKRYLDGDVGFEEYNGTLKAIALYSYFGRGKAAMTEDVATKLKNALESDNRLDQIQAAFIVMRLAFKRGGDVQLKPEITVLRNQFQMLCDPLIKMLSCDDMPSALAASWAFAWTGEHRLLSAFPEPEMLSSLYQLWRELKSPTQARYPAWALGVQQLLPRDTFSEDSWGDCDSFLQQAISTTYSYGRDEQAVAALVVGWYRRAPWTDEQLVQLIMARTNKYLLEPSCRELLQNLGTLGTDALRIWQDKKKKDSMKPKV